MASPSMLNIAIDLINEAKGTRNLKQKLYLLEQVKEIAIHRDQAILVDIYPEITNFMIERQIEMRKFLLIFGGEGLFKSADIVPSFIQLISFVTSDNLENDNLMRVVANLLTRYYDRIVLYIANMHANKSKFNAAGAKDTFTQLRAVVSKLVEIISTDRTETLRAACIRFSEAVVVFGMPPPAAAAKVLDPRLRAQQQRAGVKDNASAVDKSVLAIALQHPFIDRNDLEQEAESLFSKLLLWASRRGPQGCPFTPMQMSALGESLSGIASLRPKTFSKAAAALIFMLQGKGNTCAAMAGPIREALARAVLRLSKSPGALSDHEDVVPKLRTALETLESLGFTDEGESLSAAAVGKKRAAGEAFEGSAAQGEGGEGEGDDEAAAESLRASARAALDGRLAEKLSKVSTEVAESSAPRTSKGVAEPTKHTAENVNMTELASELLQVSEQAGNLRMMVVGAGSADALSLRPDGVMEATQFVQLASASLQRMLMGFQSTVTGVLNKAAVTAAKLCVRCALSLSLLQITENSSETGAAPGVIVLSEAVMVTVSVISHLPSSSVLGRLTENISKEVQLPRPLWQLISFALSSNVVSAFTQPQDKLLLLILLLGELHHRVSTPLEAITLAGDSSAHSQYILLRNLYNNSMLAALSRILQNTALRPLSHTFLATLRRIPSSALALLQVLMYTGPKTGPILSAAEEASTKRKDGTRPGSVRTEALRLLLLCVFSDDAEAAERSLNHLLWASASEDFEVRTKAIGVLKSDVLPNSNIGWAQDQVYLFSVQLAVSLVGPDAVKTRAVQRNKQAQSRAHQQKKPGDIDDLGVPSNSATEADEGGEQRAGMDIVDAEESTENTEEDMPELCLLSLLSACETYDYGDSFGGSFPAPPLMDPAKIEAHVKKTLQLLSQVCLVNPSLLRCCLDLYAVAAYEDTQLNAAVAVAPGVTPSTISDVASAEKDSAVNTSPEPTKFSIICRLIKTELSTIIPAIVATASSQNKEHSYTTEDIFHIITGADPLSHPLLDHLIPMLLPDMHMPAPAGLIRLMKRFIKDNMAELYLPDDKEFPAVAPSIFEGIDFHATKAIHLLVPFLGGFTALQVEEILPYLLRSLPIALAASVAAAAAGNKMNVPADNVGGGSLLGAAFKRIISSRPPALSRASLLVALHRIDFEVYGFKHKAQADRQKVLLNAIHICLNNEEDFPSDVLCDTLSKLIQDPIPVAFLMRTAILSYSANGLNARSDQQFNHRMKKFVVTQVVPALIRKRAWVIAPKVWEGVMVAMKSLCTHKDSEGTLRCLLGIPGIQLKALLKAVPQCKTELTRVMKALSPAEREEAVSGRWAGLDTLPAPASTPAATSSSDASEVASASSVAAVEETKEIEEATKVDAVKAKIISELQGTT